MKYVVKKICALAAALFAVTMLAFAAFEVIPGDPATAILGTEATPEKIEALREEMGLNRSLPVRYGDWLTGFVTGDMGESYSYHIPVSEMIGDKLPVTGVLTLLSFLFILVISFPLGLLCARFENRWPDRVLFVANQVIMAVPAFFAGILFTALFGLMLHLFQPGAYVSWKTDLTGFLSYMIFPALAIALPKAAMSVKFFRGSLLGELRQDYVRTAYSRGNTAGRTLFIHVFRNALTPVVTFLGFAVADILANSLIVEQVFGIPGIGRILITSISNRDYPVVQAVIVLVAGVILLVNTFVDLIYRKLDGRIRLT